MQEALLKQEAQIRWFEEGDNNTKYFHNVIKDGRRRFQIHRIQNHNGRCKIVIRLIKLLLNTSLIC